MILLQTMRTIVKKPNLIKENMMVCDPKYKLLQRITFFRE